MILDSEKFLLNKIFQFQISPENDPSQNWTLIKPLPIQEDCEDEADSLFSSIKTSHSSSLKALCTCPKSAATIDDTDEIEAPSLLRRVASFPRCHPNLDPHRYSLNFLGKFHKKYQK